MKSKPVNNPKTIWSALWTPKYILDKGTATPKIIKKIHPILYFPKPKLSVKIGS